MVARRTWPRRRSLTSRWSTEEWGEGGDDGGATTHVIADRWWRRGRTYDGGLYGGRTRPVRAGQVFSGRRSRSNENGLWNLWWSTRPLSGYEGCGVHPQARRAWPTGEARRLQAGQGRWTTRRERWATWAYRRPGGGAARVAGSRAGQSSHLRWLGAGLAASPFWLLWGYAVKRDSNSSGPRRYINKRPRERKSS